MNEPSPLVPAIWDNVEAPRARSALRRPLGYLGSVFLLLLVIGAFVPIGGAVIANGQVGVESRVKRIAHPTGGVIAAIAVVNGQHVERGELLMRLDDRVSGADANFSSLTVDQLRAQQARLEAERLGGAAINFPADLAARGTPGASKAMADERSLFAIRRSEEAQLQAQLGSQIAQLNQQIAGYEGQIAALRRQIALIQPERKAFKELWDKGLITISRRNELERLAASLDGSVASLEAQIASTRAKIGEAREQAIQLRESRRAQAGSELAQVNTALNQQQSRSVAAGDQQSRSEIRAPYSGTVEKIAFAAVGDVIKPAEAIMEIVPDADQLVVEAMIAPEDVDQVSAGQRASIRFSSFNLSATPSIDGQVGYIAADRSEDPQSRQAFFVARISVDQGQVRREGLALRSGMPAEVHIQTGSRSMLSYIFKPLRDQFARAFRDG